MKGDLNKDGKINLVDVNYALNCIAGNENYDYLLQNLDINNNSKFELSDINYLLNNIAGNKNYKLIDLFTEYEIEIPVAFHIIREYDDIWNSKLNKYHTSNGIIELNDDECLQKAIDILNEDFSKTIDSTYFKEYKDNYSEGQKINCIKFKLNNNNNSNNYFSINYVEKNHPWFYGSAGVLFYNSESFYNKNQKIFDKKSLNAIVIKQRHKNLRSYSFSPNGDYDGFFVMDLEHFPGYWPIADNNIPLLIANENLSRGGVLTHEIGHSFNLLHTFQEPNRIIDVPQARQLNGTYSEPILTNDNKGYEPVNNIMGYAWTTNDPKTNMYEGFTHYQMIEMIKTIEKYFPFFIKNSNFSEKNINTQNKKIKKNKIITCIFCTNCNNCNT